MFSHKTLSAFALAAVLASASCAHASLIIWETPDRISTTGDTIVETGGTLVAGVNLRHNQTGTIRTVNTVDFTTDVGAMTSTANVSSDLGTSTATVGAAVYGDGGVGATFETVLDSFGFRNPTATFTFSGLTIGNTYQVQFFTSDRRSTAANRFVEFNDGLGNLSDRVTQRNGYSTVGTFVADGVSQAVTATGYTTIGGSTTTAIAVNALQIRETAVVPEPASLAFLLLGGLVCWRRFGRK